MNEKITPKEPTEGELAKVGVELIDTENSRLRCKKCGLSWSPNALSGGRMPNGYWKCPNGCNAS